MRFALLAIAALGVSHPLAQDKPKDPGKGAAGLKAAIATTETTKPAAQPVAGSAQMTTKQIKLAIQVANTVDQVRELDAQIDGIPDDDEREQLKELQTSRIVNLTCGIALGFFAVQLGLRVIQNLV